MAGVGLLEVLIAVLILAIGMLGIAALQATALRNNQSAMERSQAVIQSYSILDAMRANLLVARGGGYSQLSTLACSVTPAAAGASLSLAQSDQNAWVNALHESLGADACGKVVCAKVADGSALNCTVTVQWDDSRGGATGEQLSDTETQAAIKHEVQTVSRI